MESTLNPFAASVRIAASRPRPIPRTNTSTVVGPVLRVFSESASITFEAANGVAFFGPANPNPPEEAQHNKFPVSSVIEISVLLYVALI